MTEENFFDSMVRRIEGTMEEAVTAGKLVLFRTAEGLVQGAVRGVGEGLKHLFGDLAKDPRGDYEVEDG